jgi:hypothetical protein
MARRSTIRIVLLTHIFLEAFSNDTWALQRAWELQRTGQHQKLHCPSEDISMQVSGSQEGCDHVQGQAWTVVQHLCPNKIKRRVSKDELDVCSTFVARVVQTCAPDLFWQA